MEGKGGRPFSARPRTGNIARNGLTLEGFGEALKTQVVVPQRGELFVLAVKFAVVGVIGARDKAAPLLFADVIVAPVKRIEVRPTCQTKLETHLRVAHGIAVLFAVVTDRDSGESART